MYDEIFSNEDMIKLQKLLIKYNKTITCAESCTGGLVSSLITKNQGSSNIFNGSIITYSNKIKNQELNVKNITLEKYGAVSIQTVKEMLSGVSEKFDAHFAIAISGIAGPTGATIDKKVGTVIIGIKGDTEEFNCEIFEFLGNRNEVQIQAAKTSLKKIYKFAQKTLDK